MARSTAVSARPGAGTSALLMRYTTVPLSDRETEVLAYLARLRYLSAAQVSEFLFAGSAVTARSRLVMTHRVLQSLRRRGLAAMTTRMFGGPSEGALYPVYGLTSAGWRIARTQDPAMPSWRLKSSGALLIRRALATADVLLAIARAARAHDGHALASWECDWQAARRLGSSCVRPDAYVVYRAAHQRIHLLTEVDLGTDHTLEIGRRFSRYLDLCEGGAWQAQIPVWPLVLVLAETRARATQLRRVCELAVARPPRRSAASATFRFATLGHLTADASVERAIWQVVGSEARVSLLADTPASLDSPAPVIPSGPEKTDGSILSSSIPRQSRAAS